MLSFISASFLLRLQWCVLDFAGLPVLVAIVCALAGARWLLRGWIYDVLVVDVTRQWYATVIDRLAPGQRVLDVGIGTATALVRNADAVRRKRLRFVGVDYDRPYIQRANQQIRAHHLDKLVKAVHASVYDYDPGHQFDAVYFSGSLMIMPDPVLALKKCAALVPPGSLIYSTQTLEPKRSLVAEWTKPLLSSVTGIDFGQVFYTADVIF